jgi:ABC-type uncharacterized transport system substrate-binding protein
MRKLLFAITALVALAFLLSALGGTAHAVHQYPAEPDPQTLTGKVRIGFLQGGDYKDYAPVLRSTVKGLMELGWIENANMPDTDTDGGTRALWDWLATKAQSEHLVFVADAFYTSDWNEEVRPKTRQEVLDRLTGKGDIQLMIAMGTWAGQDLASDKHSTPTLVFSTSDPLGAGIIKSANDSGLDHVWARVDPTRYERQVALFHDIIGFEKLGVVYEDTEVGRSMASLSAIQATAKQRGFHIEPCFAPFSKTTPQEALQNVIQCHRELASKVDAVYITHHRGVQDAHMAELMAPFFENNVPTFSQAGSAEVRKGSLMSISQANFVYVGRFYAETFGRVANGATPRSLNQVFESPPKIAINLETAERINYDPPVDILGAADEIYETIEQ